MAKITQESTPPRRSRESVREALPKPRPRISIVDHTLPAEDSGQSLFQSQSPRRQSVGDVTDPSITGSQIKASRTRSATLRDQKAKWKYGKYTEDRATGRPISRQQTGTDGLPTGSIQELTRTESQWGQSALDRGKKKIQTKVLRRKQTATVQDVDTEIDVLYENQRGAFFCGIPFFSPKALNPTDPAPWVDGDFKRSRENITNAQVPDPSWEWVWRTWYVDMSRDVDEEGWEYSFFFKGFSWHGTHPWFHSFVRRRRWIRKRIRRVHDRDMTDPHDLTKDYFTIHTGRAKSTRSRAGSIITGQNNKKWGVEEKAAWEEDDITDIGTLIHALRIAPVDSERIALIKNFIEHGGEDLFYLADEMPNIMSYFFHEHSCRRLLSLLTDKIQSADDHLQEHKDSGEAQDADEERYTNALLKAAKSVDDQCKQLQFWSDARDVPRITKVSFGPNEGDSGEEFDTASEHSQKASEDQGEHGKSHSISPTTTQSEYARGKGKAPMRTDDISNVGGYDGAHDPILPKPVVGPSIVISSDASMRSDPRKNSQQITRSRASRSSLSRQSSRADSVNLAELVPEPLDDQMDEAEAPVHVRSKQRRLSRPRSSNGKKARVASTDSQRNS